MVAFAEMKELLLVPLFPTLGMVKLKPEPVAAAGDAGAELLEGAPKVKAGVEGVEVVP